MRDQEAVKGVTVNHLNIIIAIYIFKFSRTYTQITVQLEFVLEMYYLLFVSGSALVNRVTNFMGLIPRPTIYLLTLLARGLISIIYSRSLGGPAVGPRMV